MDITLYHDSLGMGRKIKAIKKLRPKDRLTKDMKNIIISVVEHPNYKDADPGQVFRGFFGNTRNFAMLFEVLSGKKISNIQILNKVAFNNQRRVLSPYDHLYLADAHANDDPPEEIFVILQYNSRSRNIDGWLKDNSKIFLPSCGKASKCEELRTVYVLSLIDTMVGQVKEPDTEYAIEHYSYYFDTILPMNVRIVFDFAKLPFYAEREDLRTRADSFMYLMYLFLKPSGHYQSTDHDSRWQRLKDRIFNLPGL